jgi:hypothetical protein
MTKRLLMATLIFFGSTILLQGMLLGWSLLRIYRSHATGFVIVHVPVLVLLPLGLLAYWLSGKLVRT